MHPTTHAEVAVLVLNWNGRSLLETFLPSWVQHTPAGADLIIVDNGSTDDSVAFVREHYPEVRLHLFTENLGFAAGYNKAIAELDYKTVVLLNSDVELSAGWLDEPLRLLDSDPTIAAVQPTIRAQRDPKSFESTLVLLVASSTRWAIPSAVAVSSVRSRRTTGSTLTPRISSGHRAPASSSAVTSISRSAGWIRSSSPIRRRSTCAGDSMPVGIASPSPPPRSSTTSVVPASRQRAQGRSSSTSGTTS